MIYYELSRKDSKLFSPQLARERLDAKLLVALGLINNAGTFDKRQVVVNSRHLYRQQKFNLLREENEGYSKLLSEVETFIQRCPNVASDSKARQLTTNIQSLVGYFDLDPNRVLDLLMDIAANNLRKHWQPILRIFSVIPWCRSSVPSADSQNSVITNEKQGNQAAAQILGFNFRHYEEQGKAGGTPEELYMLAALLVKSGFIKLADLWSHVNIDQSLEMSDS